MAAEEGEREKGRASVMIRRCFNDSAFLWQRACRGWPPRRPASVSSGGGECIERPAAILVDTQPRFSGMNFCVCARVRACTPVPFSLPVLLSLYSAIPPPCDAHTRDRPLLSSLARSPAPGVRERRGVGRGAPPILSAPTSTIFTSAFVFSYSRATGKTSNNATLFIF